LRKSTPRAICLEILNRVDETGRHADRLLTDAFKRYRHLTPLDQAFLTDLTYGTLRWRGKLDWVIQHFSNVPFDKVESKLLNVLRIGLYQILFMSRTPVAAAVNESVELAKKFRGKGGGSFFNGILRSFLREKECFKYPEFETDPALHVAVEQSHPLWLVKRWMEELGAEETLQVCTRNNQPAPLTLRTNTLRVDRTVLIQKLKEQGLHPVSTPYSPEGITLRDPPPVSQLPFWKEGLYVIQDEASQLVTTLLDPHPGETILDACAAPGGKTTHIAQRMRNSGRIYALDLSRPKLGFIEDVCSRLGVTLVKTLRGDAGQTVVIPGVSSFDRILADVPCSGFGTLRRNPDLKWRRGEGDVERLSELQGSILANLSGYLRKDGILVYSTCTVFPEENEDIVEGFLRNHPEFHLDPVRPMLPEEGHAFASGGYFKTFPPKNGMDNFFVARLMKTN
jgi:16S rRNA (cytosine967-C5)-methyltransferase